MFHFIGIADKAGTPIEDKKAHRENTRKIQKEDRVHTYRIQRECKNDLERMNRVIFRANAVRIQSDLAKAYR